jgi:hypothetical protein
MLHWNWVFLNFPYFFHGLNHLRKVFAFLFIVICKIVSNLFYFKFLVLCLGWREMPFNVRMINLGFIKINNKCEY